MCQGVKGKYDYNERNKKQYIEIILLKTKTQIPGIAISLNGEGKVNEL